MKKILFIIGIVIMFFSCDPADDKLKIVNQYKDDILIDAVLTRNHYFTNLSMRKQDYKSKRNESSFSFIGDTITRYTLGDWKNKFTNLA